jgi:hypothetical protein
MNSAENQLSEDYPASFNKQEFEKIKSFQGKLNYAVTHLRKIASGSARTVFAIDDKKALKIAKNKKGLAQNAVEMEAYLQQYEITARVFDKDQNNDFWLEMELAKKLSPKRFKEITGVSIEETSQYARYKESLHRRGRSAFGQPDNFESLENNEFLIDLMSLMMDYDMPAGDLGRLSSYGEISRDGKPYVVLVDFGLTNTVYDDFYKVGKKQPSFQQ